MELSVKIAGVHWLFTKNHAAEWTAGYFNTKYRNGYSELAKLLHQENVVLCFTCVEKFDSEELKHCKPEKLVQQVIDTCKEHETKLSFENAFECYDRPHLDQIIKNCKDG